MVVFPFDVVHVNIETLVVLYLNDNYTKDHTDSVWLFSSKSFEL